MTHTIKARDLFAGIGWGVALKAMNIEDHGVEWDDDVRKTREINHLPTIGRDVRDVRGSHGRFTTEIGSPSCERFTQTGHGDGSKARAEIVGRVSAMKHPTDIYNVINVLGSHHEQVTLVLEPFRVLLENPHAQAAVWEQVVPVLPIWDAIADKLRNWGWHAATANVRASWYGVPQDRRRAILLARRDRQPVFPDAQPAVPMRAVLPGCYDGRVQRSNYSAPAGEGRKTAQERGRTMRTLDDLSVTMTRKAAQWLHRDRSLTKLTVEDMKDIQTFARDMPLSGGVMSQRLQIGNAVPPLMAEALVRAVIDD